VRQSSTSSHPGTSARGECFASMGAIGSSGSASFAIPGVVSSLQASCVIEARTARVVDREICCWTRAASSKGYNQLRSAFRNLKISTRAELHALSSQIRESTRLRQHARYGRSASCAWRCVHAKRRASFGLLWRRILLHADVCRHQPAAADLGRPISPL